MISRTVWLHKVSNDHIKLSNIERILDEFPDSAFYMLQNTVNSERLSKKNSALFALLMTRAQCKMGTPIKDDSLIQIALKYYSDENDSISKAWSYLFAAQFNQKMRDDEKAIKYLQYASLAASKSNNYELLGLIYYHWGILLQKRKPYEESLNKLLKSKKYVELSEDTVCLITVLKSVSECYVDMKKYKEARKGYKKCIKLAKGINDQTILAQSNYKIALSYCMEDNYIYAFYYINQALKQDRPIRDSLMVYSAKARIMLGLQEYDSARLYIEKGKYATDYYGKASYQDGMACLEEKLGNYQNALIHRNEYAKYLDSITDSEVNLSVLELQSKYDYSLVKSENNRLKIDNQKRKIMVLVTLFFSMTLFFVLYYLHNRVKNEKDRLLYSKDLLLSQSLNQIQQKSNELLNEKHLIQEKEEELKLHLMKEKELVKDISHKKDLLCLYENKQKELKKQLFEMDMVVKKINSLKKMSDKQKVKSKDSLMLSEQERDDFIAAIDSCFDQIASRLHKQFSTLSNDDLCICGLLRMGISNSDIVILLNTSEEAFKKRKYRIKREKIGLFKDKLSLEDYLLSF